jgi:hypothetical protein
MYSKKPKTYITVPKNNQDIKENIDNNKNKKFDYETIRNIVLEKSNNNVENYNKSNESKTKTNKFNIV